MTVDDFQWYDTCKHAFSPAYPDTSRSTSRPDLSGEEDAGILGGDEDGGYAV